MTIIEKIKAIFKGRQDCCPNCKSDPCKCSQPDTQGKTCNCEPGKCTCGDTVITS